MEILFWFLAVGAWIWSVARGIQVSVICMVLNFLAPPISQLIFAVYEEKMRRPLLYMVIGLVGLFFTGTGVTQLVG
ncbi:hypothetical protein [Hahella ganghwensis]|uniref:hypothetical protein n=1 Tax=Hahella ganghwensis TaxID=286420 RepID=UPI000362C4AE|nr:hypothetical protein [Hahella ganghwensis]